MNRAQIDQALREGAEVAVYCDADTSGYPGGNKPNDLFDGDAYKLVVRCRVVATGRRRVASRGPRDGARVHMLSLEADYTRVRPLDPLPAFGSGDDSPGPRHTPGVRPPHPDFKDGTEGPVYDEGGEYLTTSRMIISTWAQWVAQVAAFEQQQADALSEFEAKQAATRAALDAARTAAARLTGLGFDLTIASPDRAGIVEVPYETVDRVASDLQTLRGLLVAAAGTITDLAYGQEAEEALLAQAASYRQTATGTGTGSITGVAR